MTESVDFFAQNKELVDQKYLPKFSDWFVELC